MIICFTTSLSNIIYAADLTVKVRDPKTGETIFELEQEEQAKQARGGLPALPAGSPQKVQLEYQRLIEEYNKKLNRSSFV